MKLKYLIFTLLLAGGITPLAAQDRTGAQADKPRRAWEFGLGGTVYQFNRTSFSNFSKLDNGGYMFDLKLKNTVWGGNIYVARELSNHFYLDLQANVGYAGETWGNDNGSWLYTGALGLQWRLGGYFNSKYIDPYLRVGAGYMYKDFTIFYTGTEGLSSEEMKWVMDNLQNKAGADKKHLFPVSAGVGVNMWLNDRWGIGLQGDYVLMPYKDVANSLQGTVRIMYRLGGKTKKSAPVVQYVDRPVDRVVEKIVEVEKVVEKIVEVPGKEKMLINLFNNIHFDFDKATLTSDSEAVLDQVADIIKKDTNDNFLITGFTDARGSQQYNQSLSERRAKTVVDALVQRGVPKDILKARGVAGRIAIAAPSSSDEIRRGDRKVTIEIINNREYWDYLKERLY